MKCPIDFKNYATDFLSNDTSPHSLFMVFFVNLLPVITHVGNQLSFSCNQVLRTDSNIVC